MSLKIVEVNAPVAEVEAVLRANLTAQEFAAIRISGVEEDPFAPLPHRDFPDIQTVVEFVLASVASGITYDLLAKVAVLLRAKLGSMKVRETEKQSKGPDKKGRSGSDNIDGSE